MADNKNQKDIDIMKINDEKEKLKKEEDEKNKDNEEGKQEFKNVEANEQEKVDKKENVGQINDKNNENIEKDMKIEQNNFQQPSKPSSNNEKDNKIIKNIIPGKEPKSNFIKYLSSKINFFLKCILNPLSVLIISFVLAIIYPDKTFSYIKFLNKTIFNKEKETEQNKIIIGVDFGSTQSGYQIFYNSEINFDGDEESSIITTELIFDLYFKKGLSIGQKAKFFPKENIETEKKLYFSKFKRNLDPKNKNNMANSTIPIGGQLESDIVIKEFLVLIKDNILENVKRINYTVLKDIKWILTVPPLWDDNAKDKMKDLAIKAEMANVEIALEPEVASLSIFYDQNINKELLKPPSSFLIVDMGGLTIDFTAMRILDSECNLEQLLEPVSFSFGSNFINEKIINIIETVYGKEKLDQVKKTNYKLWEQTLDEIEEKKKVLDDNEAGHFNISINFNDGSCRFWGDNCYLEYNGTEIPYTSKYISIPKHLVIEIINDLANKIVGKIDQKIRDTNAIINMIIITGGFSNNKILSKKIKSFLESSQREIIFLKEPEKTVMKGAAIFGIKPNQIKKRIMPFSIGIFLSDNNFYTYVKRGESVDVSEKKVKSLELIGSSIQIYYNKKNEEINDENKLFLYELKIPYSDILDKRKITIYMRFSNSITVDVEENSVIIYNKKLYYPYNNDDMMI